MLPDFELIIHKFPREDITIIPIADVHLGARECMETEFRSFIGTVAEKPNVYVCLLGDLISNGLKNSVTNVYEEVYRPFEQKKMMAKILEPIQDRILFSIEGNHERRSSRDCDDSVNYDIMAKLDLEMYYRPNMAFVKLQFGDQKMDGLRNPTYTICGSHGSGGGSLTGGGINKTERFAAYIDNLDCFISGHTHRPAITQPGKIYIDTHNNQVKLKPFKVITATSWLNPGGYPFQKLLTPTSHALQTLTLRGDRKEMVVTM